MKSSRAIFLFLVVASWWLMFPLDGLAGEGEAWPAYKGAWFEIKYPPNFRVQPSLKSATSVKGYDSAFFLSPDQEVEFYVFSPQWSGNPTDIEMNPEQETLVSQDFEKRGDKKVRMVTVQDKTGAYKRSFIDTQDTLSNTRLVFGFKYRDQQSYNKYRQNYLRFKSSLKQFAD
jgi:hypothetical protein